MKLKKLNCIVMSMIMIFSVIFCAVPSASADTVATEVNKVYSCKNITQISNYFQQGSYSYKDTTNGSGDWSKVYSFTITDDAYVGVNFAFSKQSEYNTEYPDYHKCSCEVYFDPYCSSKVDMEKSVYNNNAYFDKLAKGTYYVKATTNFIKSEDFVFIVGQLNKNTQFVELSVVRSQEKTATFKLNTIDGVKKCWVYFPVYFTREFGMIEFSGSNIALIDNEYTHTFADNEKYSSFGYIDVNGFKHGVCALYMMPNKTSVKGITNKQYTGSSITQNPIITVDTKNASYYISYKNNKNVGTATMTITGKGDTIGTITRTFKINPANIAKGSCSVKGKYAYLSWSNSKGATTYRVQKLVGKTWKTIKNTSSNKLKVSVSKGKSNFRVCGYKKVGKTTYYSANKVIVVNRKK